mgnify:CR=1 FL=1|tara:strand:+ start:211 stop:417 length:207 start_codon:yes stop_codon:yes gene_type:complete
MNIQTLNKIISNKESRTAEIEIVIEKKIVMNGFNFIKRDLTKTYEIQSAETDFDKKKLRIVIRSKEEI